MDDISQQLKIMYPLLDVLDPANDADFRVTKVPEAMYVLIGEFIMRYAFVSHKNRKGDIGEQADHNSYKAAEIRKYIMELGFEGKFTFKFHGMVCLVTINPAAEYGSDKVTFEFIEDITPVEAATNAS